MTTGPARTGRRHSSSRRRVVHPALFIEQVQLGFNSCRSASVSCTDQRRGIRLADALLLAITEGFKERPRELLVSGNGQGPDCKRTRRWCGLRERKRQASGAFRGTEGVALVELLVRSLQVATVLGLRPDSSWYSTRIIGDDVLSGCGVTVPQFPWERTPSFFPLLARSCSDPSQFSAQCRDAFGIRTVRVGCDW